VACAAEGVLTVVLISSNEIMKAEAAAASRLVKEVWLVIVSLLVCLVPPTIRQTQQ
jgi:hypothetical protein